MNRIRLLRVLAIFVALGCVPAWAAEPGLPRAKPAEAGLNADQLARIPVDLQKFIDEGAISGAVTLVAKDGKIVQLEAVGLADVEGKQPMKEDALFAIASMTKPITATALMILVDEGKVALDDPVSKYIPAFKEAALKDGKPKREITLRDLLTHTSGLTGSQQNEGTLKATAEALAKRPLSFEPGSKWTYSPGLSVIGRVIEVAAGKPYEAFLKERIFDPLGMVDTSFHPSEAQQKRLARLYKPGKEKKTIEATTHWLIDFSGKNPPNPSGGLFSTAADLSRFYQMVLNGGELDGKRIVSKKAVAEMTRLQTGELTTGFTPGNGWGLGRCLVREPQGVSRMLSPGSFGHGGAFGTQGWLDPKRNMMFVLLIQRTGFGNSDASALRDALQENAVKALK
ncbi:MAG: serine hydrolase domain-containing protein [Gemmataceae bacterium]